MKKMRIMLVGLCLIALCVGSFSVNAADTVKIGYVENLTGQQATLGQYCLSGVKLAVDDINAAGGVNGKKLELITEDTRSDTTGAVSALQKIIAEHPDISALIVPPYTAHTLAMEPIIKKFGVPTFTGGTNASITRLGNKWMFRNRPDDTIVASVMAAFAVDNLKAKKIAIFHNNDSFGSGGATALKNYLLKKYKITPVAVEGHNTGDKDFSAQLMIFRKNKYDTILSYSFPIESGLLTRQMVQMGLKVNRLIGSPAMASADTLQLTSGASEGVYAVADCIPVTDKHPDKKVAAWAKRYHAKQGVYSDYGAAYYDSVQMFAEAIKKAGSSEREAIREALHSIKGFKGMAQTYTIDEIGEAVHSAAVVQVKKGVPVPIKVITID